MGGKDTDSQKDGVKAVCWDEVVIPMRIDDLIAELKKARAEHGNLDIKLWVSWFEGDDTRLMEANVSLIARAHKRLGKMDFIISGNDW